MQNFTSKRGALFKHHAKTIRVECESSPHKLYYPAYIVISNVIYHLSSPDDKIRDIYSGVVSLDTIENTAKSDVEYCILLKVVREGFPNSKYFCEPAVKSYCDKRNQLTSYRNVVLIDDCKEIPQSLHKTIRYTLHSAHQSRTQNTTNFVELKQT